MNKWTALAFCYGLYVIGGVWIVAQQYLLAALCFAVGLCFGYVHVQKLTRDDEFIAQAEQERKARLEQPIETTSKNERDSRLFVPQPLD